jgi:tripartite-type tricarboxylate transporter receptor subunit TctC
MKCFFKPKGVKGLLAVGAGTIFLTAALLFSSISAGAAAKDYPNKSINIIVPWSAGGSTDLSARTLAPVLSRILRVSVMVINKPGGSGIIGTLDAVKSAPDGYTLLADCGGTSSIQYAWAENLPYKVEERTYIARAAYTPQALGVPGASPWKNMDDLMQAIRTNPAGFRWSLIGGTGVPDVITAQLRAALMSRGLDLSKTRSVTYKGTGEVLIALGGNHVDIGFGGVGVATPLKDAGKIRALAVVGSQRYKGWPDVPSTAEIGFGSVDLVYWVGLSGPPGLPASIMKTLTEAIKSAVSSPELTPHLDTIGFVPGFQPPDEYKKFVLQEGEGIKGLKLR